MTEPTDPIKALIEPLTGDLVGAWGTSALNVNFTAIGGMLGGSQTISLAAATTFTLSAPSGSITPGAGPNQAQNAILKFTGTLSGNAVITLPLPGYYIVNNACVVGANYIQMRAVGAGAMIGLPQGKQSKIWCDGIDVGFCDAPEVGSYMDLASATTPSWFAGCSPFLPWIICDGNVWNAGTISPALGALLGSTFGGDGVTNWRVPDQRARMRIPLDNQGINGAAGRVNGPGSGISGVTVGGSGGSQSMQQHNHGITDPTHAHSTGFTGTGIASNFATGGVQTAPVNNGGTSSGSSSTGITVNNTGTGSSQNMPPTLVAGISLIKN